MVGIEENKAVETTGGGSRKMMAIESSKRPGTMSKYLTQRRHEDEEMNSRILEDDELCSRGTTIYSYISPLLGLGALPDSIDTRLLQDYTKEPQIEVVALPVPGVDNWEERGLQEIYHETAANLHLTMRYLLWRADKLPTRQQSLKECNDLLDLSNSMELPFHIIGQEAAVYITTSFIRNYLVANIYIPRVLLLTGPPSHGKSEMITQIRDHFKIKTCELDCGGFQSASDVLDSDLNSFLAVKESRHKIVVMEEFEKAQ
jgi:hypothetical protein